MTTIKIIFPYFGTFPPQFKFWWASALNNPDVEFIIVTDNKGLKSEQNIHIVYMDFDECRKRVQRTFSFPVVLPTPYKLCDYKPAYYLIFNDIIGECDFWGWGDLDLIYGRIRRFVTEEVLSHYDVISGWGHLTLMRNTDYWRHFVELKENGFMYYRDVYQDPHNFGFDEYWHGGTADKAKFLHPDKVWDSMLFDDLRIPETHINFKSGNRRMFENDHLIFEYADGEMWRVFLVGEKVRRIPTLYMHFKRRLQLLKVETENTDCYLVIPNRIIDWQQPTWQKVYQWSHCGLLRQYFTSLRIRTIRKLNNLWK